MMELSNHRRRRYTVQSRHDNTLHEHESKSVKEPTYETMSTTLYFSKFILSIVPTPSTARSYTQTPAKTCSIFSDSPRRHLTATLEIRPPIRVQTSTSSLAVSVKWEASTLRSGLLSVRWSGGRSRGSGSSAVANISTCQCR